MMRGSQHDSSLFMSSSSSSSSSSGSHHEIGRQSSSSSSSLSSSPSPCSDDHAEDDRELKDQWLRFVNAGEIHKGSLHWDNVDAEQESLDPIDSSNDCGFTIDFCAGEGQKGGMQWDEVEERFDRVVFGAGHESTPTIDASLFGFCIGMHHTPEFASELLEALRGRRNHDVKLTKRELHGFWHRLINPCQDSKMQIFFDMCDRDIDGRVTKEDFKQILLLSASANKLGMKQEEAEHFASIIMQEVDIQQRGYIEFFQLKNLLKATSSSKGYLTTEHDLTVSTSLNSPDLYQDDHDQQEQRTMSLAEILFRNYWRRAWIVTLWLVACIGLFSWKFIQYKHRAAFQVMGYCLSTAKGAAETLKLNMALILLPVCRNCVTWLRRSHRMSSIIPFNDNINFHKLIAAGIVIGVILHGGTHLACDFPRITGSSPLVFQRTFGTAFGNQQPTYLQVLCTTEVATGITMVILMAIAFSLATRMPRRQSPSLPGPIRRVTGYNTFWYSHHLLIIVYVLLIIHSMFLFLTSNFVEKTTWMYLAIPVLLYLGERIYRSIRSEIYEVDVLQATMYPGKVMYLKLSKPSKFTYKSGMYIYLKCPQISPFEWHPFSLTSGPNDDHLSIHIRTLGDWSDGIHNIFQEAMCSTPFNYPKVYIDGPYGAASQDHVKYDIVVLIGLGIGATPFISILKDIGDRFQEPLFTQENDVETGVNECPLKAYFYWVTREHSSLGWFEDAMNETSKANQKQEVIGMHNFLTSVYERGDARSILLSTVQDLYFMKSGIDVFSKTQVRTHFSRPNWFRIFSDLACRHTGSRIGVFYCGSSNLARELEGLCTKFSTKTTTRFVFHKENY